MWTAYVVVAEAGLTWTPAIFYVVAAVVQLILVLVVFRLMGLPAEYNTFVGAMVVVVPVNGVGYLMRNVDLLFGFLAPSVLLFALLAMVARGDVLKAMLAGALVMASYLGLAQLVEPRAEEMTIEDLGGIAQVLNQGGLEAKGITEADLKNLTGREDDEE